MEEQQLYAKDTVQRLYELLQSQLGGRYKVFPAFPLTPPTDNDMPCIIIDRKTDGAVIGPTSTDEVTEIIDIMVLKSSANAIGGENPKTDTKRELELFIQGQDPVTLDYRADTLYYILRTYLTLLQTDGPQQSHIWLLDSNVQTTYDTGKLAGGITNIAFSQTRLSTQRRVIVSRSG